MPMPISNYDRNWAGDKISRKSTSGGIAFLGSHCLKSWSSNQTIIALSSAEAELYALLKGASQSLGLVGKFVSLKSITAPTSMFAECGAKVKIDSNSS